MRYFSSGPVPAEYNRLFKLANISLPGNQLSGALPNFLLQQQLRSADLSGNRFYGQLPQVRLPVSYSNSCSRVQFSVVPLSSSFKHQVPGWRGYDKWICWRAQDWCGRNFTVNVQDNPQLCGALSRILACVLSCCLSIDIGHSIRL